jgi:hypothetical protein
MNTPTVRLPSPSFDWEPDDSELGWENEDYIPVNVDGETEEESDEWR